MIKNGFNCDGSSIKCYKTIRNSDLHYDLDTTNFYLLPNNILTFFCYSKFKYDSRYNLMKITKKLEKMKLFPQIGAEIEFFLFDQNKSKANLKKLERVGYYSEINIKKLKALNEIVKILDKQNFDVEAVHHECAPNQYELDFKHNSPINIADKILVAKQVIKIIAKKHNLYASFMPKPIINIAGSGMHINVSIQNENENLFFDSNRKYKMSSFSLAFVENIKNHIGSICAFSNPLMNSYKRLNGNYETPNAVDIGYNNRQSCFRIPKHNKLTARVELRFPDISCQVYLSFCAILLSGLENLLTKKDITHYDKIKLLPFSLNQSLEYLKRDMLLKKLVPDSFFEVTKIRAKKYLDFITSYEIKHFL